MPEASGYRSPSPRLMPLGSPSPRVMPLRSPAMGFNSSPLAQGLGTPSTPFKAGLKAFPSIVQEAEDDYSGFDDTWRRDYEMPMNDGMPSAGNSRFGTIRRNSTTMRPRTSSQSNRHMHSYSLGGAQDLEDFFDTGILSPDREATSAIDQALKLGSSGKAQPPLRSVNNNLDSQIERTTGILGRLRSPASSKLMDPSNVKRDLKDVLEQAKLAAGVMHGTPSTTTVSTPASSTTRSPDLKTNHNLFTKSPGAASNASTFSPVSSLSDGMLRPMTNMPRFPPLDYPARIRALSESVSNSSRNLNNLKAQYELDKAELKASPPRAPYAARKQLHQLGEKQRRIDEQTLAQEAKNHFQQLKAEHKAREAEKDRLKDAQYAKLKEERDAVTAAKLKAIADEKAKKEAEEKAEADKKKAEDEAKAAQVKQAMAAASAMNSPVQLTEQEMNLISMYLLHLQNGGQRVQQYEELLKKYYAVGHTDAALMQHLEDLQNHQIFQAAAAAKQAEQAKAAEAQAQAQAEAEAIALAAAEQAARDTATRQTEAAIAAATASATNVRPGSTPRRSPGSRNGTPHIPNLAFPSPSTSGTGGSPSSVKQWVEELLQLICDDEEVDRQHAMQAMLQTNERGGDKSRFVEVTKDCSEELRVMANSQMRLSATVFPIPKAHNPNFQDIVLCQLKNVIVHFRVAAARLGASAVTHLRYHETKDANGATANLGRVTCYIVQQMEYGVDGPRRIPSMDLEAPYREYRKHRIPERVLPQQTDYEILVERA